MLPLAEQSNVPQSGYLNNIAPVAGDSGASNASRLATESPNQKRNSIIAQLDGPVDDEDDEDAKKGIKDELFDDDDDEDAINSDLDDPDDNAIEEEQDEGRPNQIMLCTYDKVQRVKNKWKCTLKDGVLNTGGKE